MARQGQSFDAEVIERIASLLATTDMTIREIADRMSCSSSAVSTINRKRKIREYNGCRGRWEVRHTPKDDIRPVQLIS